MIIISRVVSSDLKLACMAEEVSDELKCLISNCWQENGLLLFVVVILLGLKQKVHLFTVFGPVLSRGTQIKFSELSIGIFGHSFILVATVIFVGTQ